jgi:hypothetical protein
MITMAFVMIITLKKNLLEKEPTNEKDSNSLALFGSLSA